MRKYGRELSGGFLVITGFLLSPLSWWNDLYVNIPMSYAFASLAGLIYKPAFPLALVIFYWLTNAAGLIMMHKGAGRIMGRKTGPYTKKKLLVDIAWALAYTAVILALVKFHIIRPVSGYF